MPEFFIKNNLSQDKIVVKKLKNPLGHFLKNNDVKTLCSFSLERYCLEVWRNILSSQEIEAINILSHIFGEKNASIRLKLLVIAFVFRHTNYITSLTELAGSHKSNIGLLTTISIKINRQYTSLWQKISKESESRLKAIKKGKMFGRKIDKCNFNLFEKISKNREDKESHNTINQHIAAVSGYQEGTKKFTAFRMRYYRWKKNPHPALPAEWPTIEFITFLEILYLQYFWNDDLNAYVLTRDEYDLHAAVLQKMAQSLVEKKPLSKSEGLKQMYEKIPKMPQTEREKELKKLACMNYLPAIQDLVARNGSVSERKHYLLRGAILGNQEFAQQLEWKSWKFSSVDLACFNRWQYLRIVSTQNQRKEKVQKDSGKILFFKFTISLPRSETAQTFFKIERGIAEYSPELRLTFSEEIDTKTITIRIKATPNNLDKIMKKKELVGCSCILELSNKKKINTFLIENS